ncbi:DUF418 domain-containing protein [Actinokineospora sp. NBRC 105648]|uniref:DUF418 domain-containing protein n=1 Tax=Actinokineospora sp. NBRC 105648 TaxID=3032206 RepID=UPI0024A50C33|nr:DUF418 domain-containing protein [Actinokineospora sp. NBRC 105648]GLZ40469.1 hypothetical protein Acsp05_40930 [Actinokineospora sp. NBRC 105648]
MGDGRITALDVLRGIAILGTFGTNVWIFTTRAALGAGDPVETGLRTLSNGKFLALLSILFGVGLALQEASARRRGARWPGRYPLRAALLFVEGALHYVLVFEFDVLMYYAVVAVPVAFLVGRVSARWWMIGAGALHVVFVGLVTAALANGDASVTLPADTSSWLGQVQTRLEHAAAFRAEAIFVLPLSTALFLAGAALLRAGAFERSARGAIVRRRLITWGLGVGIPINALTAYAGPQWALVDRYLAAPVVAFGLLGAVTALVHRMGAPGLLRRAVTAVGRCALSCYVAQNLLAAFLCYDWGLGLTGRLGHLGLLWTVGCHLVVSATVLVAATWWLRRHTRGPVELVWDLAYRRDRVPTR